MMERSGMDGCDSNQEDVTQEDNGEASFGRVVFGGIWWCLVVSRLRYGFWKMVVL